MPVHHRHYVPSGEDFNRMWSFLRRDYASRKDGFVWSHGRLGDWKFGIWNEAKAGLNFFREHAELWLDGFGEVQGFVIDEDGDNRIFILAAKGYEALYPIMLDWAVANWLPRQASLRVEVHEDQVELQKLLAAGGFSSLGVVATTRAYDLTHNFFPGAPNLPAGSRVVTMAENGDYNAKAILFRDAFEEQDTLSEVDLARYAYSRQNPAYDPTLDFSLISDMGQQIATCVAFRGPGPRCTEVEKIAVRRGFRGQGVGAAFLQACFEHLEKRSFKRAYITGYSDEANALYEKLFPAARRDWTHYALQNPAIKDALAIKDTLAVEDTPAAEKQPEEKKAEASAA